jgi:hypothetical protein
MYYFILAGSRSRNLLYRLQLRLYNTASEGCFLYQCCGSGSLFRIRVRFMRIQPKIHADSDPRCQSNADPDPTFSVKNFVDIRCECIGICSSLFIVQEETKCPRKKHQKIRKLFEKLKPWIRIRISNTGPNPIFKF